MRCPFARCAPAWRIRLAALAALLMLAAAPPAVGGVDSWTSGNQPGGRPTSLAFSGDLALAGITGFGAGGAVLRSADAGTTWQRVDAFPPEDVFDVAVHPAGLALAATRHGLFRSADGGVTWGEIVPAGLDPGQFWIGVEIDQARPSHVFAARFSISGGGVWRSTNGGLGGWTALTAGLPNVHAVTDMVVDPATHYTWGWGGFGIFVLGDGSSTWAAGNVGLPALGVRQVVVDAAGARVIALASSDLVYLPSTGGPTWLPLEGGLPGDYYGTRLVSDGAGNAWTTNLFDARLWRLPAGGATWTPADTGLPAASPNVVTADRSGANRALTVPPALNAGEGPLWRTLNGGATWSPSASGFQAVFVNGVAADPRVPGRVIVATAADAVQRSSDGGATWSPGATGLPAGAIHDVVADGVTPGVFYAGTHGGGVYRSSDGGASWAPIGTGDPATPVQLAADPARAGLVYTRFNSDAYRSTDAGVTWGPLPTAGLPPNLSLAEVVPDLAAPGAVYWVGTTGVYRLSEGAPAWTPRRAGLPPDVYAVDLAIDPRNPARMVLATDVGVWRSGDAGASWLPATGVAAGYPWSVAIDPHVGDVHVSAGNRVYGSTDGGASFSELDPGATVTPLLELVFDADGRTLYGATSTRGLLARTRSVPTGPGPGGTPTGGTPTGGTPTAASAPLVAARPRVTGRLRVRGVLRLSPATFTGTPAASITTAWQRCNPRGGGCIGIPGAGAVTYRPTLADVGRRLRVAQRAVNPSGTALAVSAPTGVVPSPAAVSGRPRVGSLLRASVGATGLTRPRLAFQWQRCAASGASCRSVAGATGRTFRVTVSDVGRRLRVRVTLRSGSRRVVITAAVTGVVRR